MPQTARSARTFAAPISSSHGIRRPTAPRGRPRAAADRGLQDSEPRAELGDATAHCAHSKAVQRPHGAARALLATAALAAHPARSPDHQGPPAAAPRPGDVIIGWEVVAVSAGSWQQRPVCKHLRCARRLLHACPCALPIQKRSRQLSPRNSSHAPPGPGGLLLRPQRNRWAPATAGLTPACACPPASGGRAAFCCMHGGLRRL